MKRSILSLLLVVLATLTAGTSHAQESNSEGSTTITATVTIKREIIRSGPYARFAQKYLGVIAPLTNKSIYTVTQAQLSNSGNTAKAEAQVNRTNSAEFSNQNTTAVNGDVFPLVTEDRFSSVLLSTEDMAREAANRVFQLRKARLDLITGEAGENVFNSGLKAALDEISRLEQEILALFLGKQMVSYETKTFSVTPVKESSNYIVARFSEDGGVVDAMDLSGEPIVINTTILEGEKMGYKESEISKRRAKEYSQKSFPADVKCSLFIGNQSITELTTVIPQLGETLLVPIVETK